MDVSALLNPNTPEGRAQEYEIFVSASHQFPRSHSFAVSNPRSLIWTMLEQNKEPYQGIPGPGYLSVGYAHNKTLADIRAVIERVFERPPRGYKDLWTADTWGGMLKINEVVKRDHFTSELMEVDSDPERMPSSPLRRPDGTPWPTRP